MSSICQYSIKFKRKLRDNNKEANKVLRLAAEHLQLLLSEPDFDVYVVFIEHNLCNLMNNVIFETQIEKNFKIINPEY